MGSGSQHDGTFSLRYLHLGSGHENDGTVRLWWDVVPRMIEQSGRAG